MIITELSERPAYDLYFLCIQNNAACLLYNRIAEGRIEIVIEYCIWSLFLDF